MPKDKPKYTAAPWIVSDLCGQIRWVMDSNDNYLLEAAHEDSEGKLVSEEEQAHNIILAGQAPKLLTMLKAINHAFYVENTTRAMREALRGSRDLIRMAENRDVETGKPLLT